MRRLFIIAWCFLLFIGTCTESVASALTNFHIQLNFNNDPSWSELWQIPRSYSRTYIIQKLGHFFGFFILSMLMTNFGRYKRGLIYAIGYGVLTELIQPFFFRDARVSDMMIDSAGIFLAYYICLKSQEKIK
ncbi:VanZ family protein [Paenibacillus polygoni]|uniref:VanZ family protein n=1 Tax=Paenibacillus polygoni TaxID=3050112 RepID=A0ABY8X4M5_9BACL|nr:VanZ family protein [Paenibacillus polygoni]WIV19998.1 VanZ family protein [Paenibacillus polygoni]